MNKIQSHTESASFTLPFSFHRLRYRVPSQGKRQITRKKAANWIFAQFFSSFFNKVISISAQHSVYALVFNNWFPFISLNSFFLSLAFHWTRTLCFFLHRFANPQFWEADRFDFNFVDKKNTTNAPVLRKMKMKFE